MDLWEEYQAGEAEDFEGRVAELRFVISYQLRERELRDRDNRHLLKMLRHTTGGGSSCTFWRSLW